MNKKYSGGCLTAIVGSNCYNWTVMGAASALGIGAGTHQIALCFEDGKLKSKNFH
jgi:homoaconitase/3-isopropylmalate dehydratase large subunit